MSVQGIESVVGGVWLAQQTTPARAADPADAVRVRKAGDDGLSAALTYGAEEYVDGRQYGSPTMFVERAGGEVGEISVQGQLDVIGLLCAALLGEDVVTGTDPYTHTISSGSSSPVDMTIWQTVGSDVGPVQQVFVDSRVSRLQVTAGVDQQVLRAVASVISLQAAEWEGTLPTARDSGDDPIRWPQGVTKVGGVALEEARSVTLDIDSGLGVIDGQAIQPVGWDTSNKGTVAHAVDGVVTDQTLPVLLRALYGTSSPSDGDQIVNQVATTSIEQTYTVEAGRRELTISTPRVIVEPGDLVLSPRAEGGTIDFTIGGRALEDSGSILTVTVKSDTATPYIS